MKHLFLSHLKVFSYKNSTNGMTDRVLCSNYQGISSMTKSKTAVGKDSRKTCNMSFTLRICITTFLCLLSLHGKGMITISAITGTSCIISWKTIADTENYYVIVGEVVEPFAQTYNTNSQNGDQEACLQALEDMGIEYSSVTPFYYPGYYVDGICLGDSQVRGYIKLPALPRDGLYRISISGYAYAADMYASLYIYENTPDGTLLLHKQFHNSNDYYQPEEYVEELSLTAGTQLVLLAGIANFNGAYGNNGRIILQNVSVEECCTSSTDSLFTEEYDKQTNSCIVENLHPSTTYYCSVGTSTDYSEITETVSFTTLPCTDVYPLPDSEISYDDMAQTSHMCVSFAQTIASCDTSKITISPTNWSLADGETHAAIKITDSNDKQSITFHANSWNSCLELNTYYTISWAPGAVTFTDGSASSQFSYSFSTGNYPTALLPNKSRAAICRQGNTLTATDGSTLQLYNTMGHRIMNGTTLDITSLPRGIYIVKCATTTLKLLR